MVILIIWFLVKLIMGFKNPIIIIRTDLNWDEYVVEHHLNCFLLLLMVKLILAKVYSCVKTLKTLKLISNGIYMSSQKKLQYSVLTGIFIDYCFHYLKKIYIYINPFVYKLLNFQV